MSPVIEARPLQPRYYLDNFERLCATVESQYGDLLRPREQEFLARFRSATLDARCLFVRLVSRRGPLYREESLDYPELADLPAALEENLALGLMQVEDAPPLDELLRLLRRDELIDVFGESLRCHGRERKRDLVELLGQGPPEARVEAWRRRWPVDQRLLAVSYAEEVALFQLLFFGNSYQDLTEFVLSDLGIASYVNYPLDPAYRLFRSRREIDDYLVLRAFKVACKEAVSEARSDALSELATALLELSVCPDMQPIRDTVCNRIARELERAAQGDLAIALYEISGEHPARERRARLLATAGRDREALALCEAMHAAPWCEAEVDFSRRQLPRLRRRLGVSCPALPRDRFDEDYLLLDREWSVERAAARHYQGRWQTVQHVESRLINGSFGLAFWSQIFAAVPGAFINPFQAAPLDMYSPQFARARRGLIDARLAELGRSDLTTELLAAYAAQQGYNNRWVSWRGLPRELLVMALAIVPREHWLACWRRILFDPEANRAGCPDLVALHPERGYCFIEVKGPGDQLQANQRRWLRFFQAEGIPARVARVEWRDG